MIDGQLRDLEVSTIGSNPIDKTSEAADKEKAADTTTELAVCPLVATMLAVETTKAAETAEAEKEKAAAVAAEEATTAATTEDQRGGRRDTQRIQTKGLLKMKAAKKVNRKMTETIDERAERFKQGLAQSMW